MDTAEIIHFLKSTVEPLPDSIFGNRYRASVILTDNTYLPCVVFQSTRKLVNLALRRFKEERGQQYQMVVESFVASGSRLAYYDIASVNVSPFAWPPSILRMIHGETSMGWTAFVAEMDDGKRFSYGTTFSTEFFDLPDGYDTSNIHVIYSGMIYDEKVGKLQLPREAQANIKWLREKPFFTCYLDGIDS